MADIKHGDVDTGPSGFKRIDRYRVFIKIVFFSKILKYSGLWPFSVLPRCRVYTHKAGRRPALAAELAEFRKIQNFKEKTQYLMNTLYLTFLMCSNLGLFPET